jgi:hypothetical protein
MQQGSGKVNTMEPTDQEASHSNKQRSGPVVLRIVEEGQRKVKCRALGQENCATCAWKNTLRLDLLQ